MFPARVLPILTIAWSLVAQAPAPAPGEPRRLTLQDAIVTSLQNNLQVQLAKETRISTQAGILSAEGAFDWNLSSGVSVGKQDYTYFGTPYQDWTRNFTAGLNKPFDWGGTFLVNYNPTYSYGVTKTSALAGQSGRANANLPYSGTLGATYTQSLLKGFGREDTGAALMVAKLGAKAADYTYVATLISLVATTESAYWDVVYGQRNLENKKQSLALAQKQLNENRIRVDVGTMAPLDVINAEAAVAQAEQNIIAAEAQLVIAQETLIRTVFPNTDRPAKVETIDAPTLGHIMLKKDEAEKMALERRVELKGAKLDVESKVILEKAATNRLKPQLDAYASYSGWSDVYGAIGPVNGDLFNTRSPGYTVGLNFSFPLLNKGARGAATIARANKRFSDLSFRDQQLSVLLDVRTALPNLEAAEKGVKAAEKTRYFTEKDLEAEKKKFDNGMSTNFLVLSKRTTLDSAKAAEVQAQINYAKAVTALEKAVGNLMEARNLKLEY
jgi:outer membrane protein